MTPALTLALRVAGTLVVAVIGWVILSLLATGALGAIYGWGGHPAIPAAPLPVYIILYLVVLPVLCLAAGWQVTGWIETRMRRKPGSTQA
jgi:hypothetical protein